MLFKLFGRTVQLRNPVKVYSKDEPILIETEGEFSNTFGKPDVVVVETDLSTKPKATETSTGFCTRQGYSYNPIHEENGKWYFWDETQADRFGPFDTKDIAERERENYGKLLNGESTDG